MQYWSIIKDSFDFLTSFSDSSDAGSNVGGPCDSGWGGAPIEANVLQHLSPMGYTGVKTKMRKKQTTFANPPVDLVRGCS